MKRFLCLILAMVLLLTGCQFPMNWSAYTAYADMEYTRPDMEAMEAALEAACNGETVTVTLKENGVVMVEQPMAKENIDDNAWITERSPLPVFADEAIQRLADIPSIKGAYHGINIKLMKCTGMREGWKMVNYARAEGMKVMVGCMTETSCAVSAAAQLAPAVDFCDLDGNLLITNDLFRGMEVIDGHIVLPDRPGIGLIRL
mgnify:CR=1 FL=1